MKLTKKLEAEVLKVYKAYWDAYLNGEMKSFGSMLDDNISVFGTAVSEVFNNKKETLRFYKATADQLVGKVQFRNRKINMKAVDNNILINEQFDLYFLLDRKWTFYGHMRVSAFLKPTRKGWQLIHQHASFPDMRAEEGEQLAAEKIKAENLQLRDAVKRRTIELENKNRELEIEAALERVRAVAMGMGKPEDLSAVGEIVFKELKGLGFTDLRNSEIIIINDAKETLTSHYYSDYGVTGVVEVLYKTNPKVKKWVKDLKKANDAFAEVVIHKKEIVAWRKYREEVGHKPDPKLNKAKEVYYYSYSIGSGGLSISTFKPASAEQIRILERFRNVFNLSYQRYIDIAQAEAQAKEARIELALERVRARAMSMQNSNELAELVSTVFNELNHLDFALTSCIIWIHDHDLSSDTLWIASSEMNKPAAPYQVKPFYNDFFNSIIPAWKAKDPKWVYTLTGTKKKNFEKAFFKELPNLSDALRKALKVPKQVAFSASFNNFGALEIVETEALTDEKFDILHRFGKVFDSSYTRFNDLKKAEAQAREGQIQLALERVRARTMAMQKSDELREAVLVIYEQLKLLNFESSACNIIIIDKESGSAQYWVSGFSQEIFPVSYNVPYLNHPYQDALLKPWIQGDKYVVYEYTGKMKQNFDEIFFTQTDFRNAPDEAKNIMIELKSVMLSTAFMTYGALQSLGAEPLSDENANILQRFAKVFEQTYTRFLDLQKAETQAREATIEAALERVRSRSMAMHKSDDLHEVIKVVIEQLSTIGLKFNVANFAKIDSDGSWDLWLSTPEQTYPALIHVPYIDHAIFNHITEQITKKSDFYTDVYDEKETNIFFHHFFENTIAKNTPEERKRFVYSSKGFARSLFLTKSIWFSVGRYDTTPFTEEENAIFKRFANVFEQSYTRFLDLQKAETQAKEAQIEASLERVRSRAMAMQTSEELNELIGTVFTELTKLDLVLTRCVILIYEGDEKGVRWWMANSEAPSTPMNFFVKYADLPFFNEYLKGWHQRSLKWHYILEGEDKIRTDNVLFNETELSQLPDFVIAGMKANNRVYLSASFNNYGCLNLASLEPLSDEHFDILLRFAKVFDLTYTRFNDLKQAEAQAKESRIQLALERVRARTMAMQKSDELAEAAQLLYEEFRSLNINTFLCGYCFYKEDQNIQTVWVTTPDGTLIPDFTDFPLGGDHVLNKRYEDWKLKKPLHVLEIKDEVNKEHHRFLASVVPKQIAQEIFSQIPDRIIFYCANFSAGYLFIIATEFLSKQEEEVITRFAKVFELSYTRFSDLKQAETQARDAQIEAALERVRNRTLLMKDSSELTDAAAVLFDQFRTLGLLPEKARTYFTLVDEQKDAALVWMTKEDGTVRPGSHSVPLTIHKPLAEMYEAWKQKKPIHIRDISGDTLDDYLQFLSKLPHVQQDEALQKLISFPSERMVFYDASYQYGTVGVFGFERISQEAIDILVRFAKVFEFTYTRFLDLQNAEAQVRESEIELALERVRAKSMSMRHSDELADLVKILFKELTRIGFSVNGCIIMTYDERTNDSTWWIANFDGVSNPVGLLVLNHSHEPYLAYLKEWKKQTPKWSYKLGGAEKKKWDQYIFKNSELAALPDAVKTGMQSVNDVHLNVCFNKYASITFGSLEPMGDKDFDTLHRFAKVFEQSYTRFLDLQNAEAQTREARIEAALEKVRSRSLAMHKSDELQEVVNTVFERLKDLNIEMDSANIAIFKDGARDYDYWIASPFQKRSASFHMPYIELSLTRDLIAARESGKDFSTTTYPFEVKNEWFDYAFHNTDFKFLSEERKQFILNAPAITIGIAFSKHTGVQVNRYNSKLLTEGEAEILRRFSKVFEQAYIRFLDLQKAEAQARDAQIETALERVRARTMGMHQSKELHDVIETVTNQLLALGLKFDNSVFCRVNEDESWEMWMSTPEQSYPSIIHVPYLDHRIFNNLKEVRTKKIKFYVDVFDQEEARVFFKHFFENTIAKNVPEERKQFVLSRSGFARSLFLTKDIWFVISRYAPDPFNDEENAILKRFAKVFEQSYTRFLDLQKAEAQAREAQIEAALERVRAASMAMHHSNELVKVATILYNQLISLGFDSVVSGGFNFPDDKSNIQRCWFADTGHEGQLKDFILPLSGDAVLDQRIEYQRKNIPFLEQILIGEELRKHMEFVFPVDSASAAEAAARSAMPDPTVFTIRFLKEGYLILVSNASLNEEQKAIVERFANAFNLAYTRFLDLQKAEAQAHEARIEISLERIRARALAMHKSDELMEVAKVLWEQMALLGQPELEASVVHLYEEDPDHIHSWRAVSIGTDSNTQLTYGHMAIPKNSCEVVREWLEKFYSDLKEYTLEISGVKQKEWYDLLFKLAPDVINSMRDKKSIHEKRFYRFSKFSGGALLMVSKQEPSAEVTYLQGRAAVVFDLAYRRFADLQNAEAQAREAQIEAALEKVRASAMAMHNSEHVSEATAVLFSELDKLGIETMRCGIVIINENQTMETWAATTTDDKKVIRISGLLDMTKHPLLIGGFKGWKNKEESYTYHLAGKDMENYYDFLAESPFYPIPKQRPDMPEHDCTIIYFKEGGLYTFSEKPHDDATIQVLKRFASVFSLTYRRYNDLKNAEAQAREAQIEASLERVRAKAMAMHSSKDLSETLTVFYRELKSLGVTPRRCGIALMDKEERLAEVTTMNTTEQGDSIEVIGQIRMSGHKILDDVYENWRKQNEYHVVLRGNEIKEYYQVLKPQMDFPDYPHDVVQYGYYFMFKEGDVYAWTENELTEDELKIYRRFTTVISLTYKRYKDLQLAEAQAKEAQIETGLERVRARTMAMHSSDDVSTATATMFTELEKLGIESFRGGILNVREDQTMDVWSVNNLAGGKIVKAAGEFDMTMHPFWQQLYKGWVNKDEVLYFNMSGKVKEDYIRILDTRRDYLPQGMQELPDSHIQSYYFGEGFVWTFTLQPHSEDDKQVMKKFASVFSLTFRRYQDLKKAEAQAREATIEAALERVRGKAMAMHSSKDLSDTIGVFYNELSGLSLTPRRCGVGLINKESRIAEISTMNSTSDGHGIELVGRLDMTGHPVLVGVYDNWLTKTEYHPVLRGNEIKEYYQFVRPQIDFPAYPDDSVQYGYFFFFEEGGVYAWTEKELHEDELKIYRRFTSVLSLTYKRYKDLKDAEARTQTAIKDAALDRIRADIASMRTINDLDRITPLIWNELTVLGIPFIRCGVFIMDEDQQLIHTFLSTPDGKAIAAFHLPYDTPGNLRDVVSNWKQKKRYIDHWDEIAFIQFADILVKQGALDSAEAYLKTIPRGGFHLHFLPFLQGMLYVGNTDQLKDEEIELIQHVADAFSTAYARYEDFNKLEAAKQQVDKTLTDLKQAQTQLVQSEKMASLGELTAGIAHEIQNPLNFVNNFSDVSNELLEEMKNELEKGNAEDAMAIVEDIKQNLEKILHHGKRADAIVKGMLQHSRTSSGQKEPTDINILADEYLRLAFHGLRAKDKSFNAKFETEFDNNIGKVNIIPQDIGRVILNLINNAFYAVTEKKKHASTGSAPNGYEPMVAVYTKKIDDKIEIKVKDNGNGIPHKVLDKIFQPFFTTKPTGQGTGLGLSLSYDIVTKGHGGELRVSTKEGEGSEFVIQLPTN